MPSDSEAYDRTLEVVVMLRKTLEACHDTNTYNGHDKMLIRQLGIMLYLTNRPRTNMVVPSLGPFLPVVPSLGPFLPAMDADFQALLRRLDSEGKGTL